MKISDEITSEIRALGSNENKEFINWVMDFERRALGKHNPSYKDAFEKKIISVISKKEHGNAED